MDRLRRAAQLKSVDRKLWVVLLVGLAFTYWARLAEGSAAATSRGCAEQPEGPMFVLERVEQVNDVGGGGGQSLWWGTEVELYTYDAEHAGLCTNIFGDCLMLRAEEIP